MPHTIPIRAASDRDASDICAIHNAQGVATTASYRLSPGTAAERAAWLARHRREGFPVLVALDGDERVIGFAAYERFRELPGTTRRSSTASTPRRSTSTRASDGPS